MIPDRQTEFLPIALLEEYTSKGYFCCGIVFSPDTENSHFKGCPPYISLSDPTGNNDVFFRVPEPVAYYGTVHAGYTMRGYEKATERGRKQLAEDIKELLYISDENEDQTTPPRKDDGKRERSNCVIRVVPAVAPYGYAAGTNQTDVVEGATGNYLSY